MKANIIVLAFLILCLTFVPLVFGTDANTLFTVTNVQTISTNPPNRNSGPLLTYIDGKLIMVFAPGFASFAGRESTDGGRTWSSFTMTGLPAYNSVYQFPMLPDPTTPHCLIGLANDFRTALVDCRATLVYSTNYGRTWSQIGVLAGGKSGYCTVYSGYLTSDGALIFASAFGRSPYSGTDFGVFTWTCPKGSNPTVLGNWQVSNEVGGSSELDEPSVVETAPLGQGNMLMVMRRRTGQVGFASSSNYGLTWGNVGQHGVPNSDQPPTIERVSATRLILCYDNTGTLGVRRPLVVAVSDDEGQTWGQPLQVADEGFGRAVCYPDLCKTSNGEITVGWWSTDVTGSGGTGQGEKCMFAILSPVGGGTTYSVTINAYCNNQSTVLYMKIYLDGGDSGFTTPSTIPNLSGTHSIQVQDVDVHGHPFGYWDNPPLFTLFALSDSMTVSGEGTHTAYYDVTVTPVLSWAFMLLFGVGAVGLVGGLYVFRWKLHLPKRRKHR